MKCLPGPLRWPWAWFGPPCTAGLPRPYLRGEAWHAVTGRGKAGFGRASGGMGRGDNRCRPCISPLRIAISRRDFGDLGQKCVTQFAFANDVFAAQIVQGAVKAELRRP